MTKNHHLSFQVDLDPLFFSGLFLLIILLDPLQEVQSAVGVFHVLHSQVQSLWEDSVTTNELHHEKTCVFGGFQPGLDKSQAVVWPQKMARVFENFGFRK